MNDFITPPGCVCKPGNVNPACTGAPETWLCRRPPTPPEPACALCGITETEHINALGWGLTDVTLSVHDGEEGASYVRRWYCDHHLDDVREGVLPLGLGSHHHGSTTFIEADTTQCGGYGICTAYEQAQERNNYTMLEEYLTDPNPPIHP